MFKLEQLRYGRVFEHLQWNWKIVIKHLNLTSLSWSRIVPTTITLETAFQLTIIISKLLGYVLEFRIVEYDDIWNRSFDSLFFPIVMIIEVKRELF